MTFLYTFYNGKMKRIGWFIFIIFIGLIPFLLRLLVFLFISSDESNIFFSINESDFILLGFIVSITNLKELKDLNLSAKTLGDTVVKEKRWIYISFIFTFFCIIIFSGIIFLSYLKSLNINIYNNLLSLKVLSILLSIISILFGFFIIGRASNIENQILLTDRK